VYINYTKRFCYISIHAYNALWLTSPLITFSPSILFTPILFYFYACLWSISIISISLHPLLLPSPLLLVPTPNFLLILHTCQLCSNTQKDTTDAYIFKDFSLVVSKF
jgi:hypothetical protein